MLPPIVPPLPTQSVAPPKQKIMKEDDYKPENKKVVIAPVVVPVN